MEVTFDFHKPLAPNPILEVSTSNLNTISFYPDGIPQTSPNSEILNTHTNGRPPYNPSATGVYLGETGGPALVVARLGSGC